MDVPAPISAHRPPLPPPAPAGDVTFDPLRLLPATEADPLGIDRRRRPRSPGADPSPAPEDPGHLRHTHTPLHGLWRLLVPAPDARSPRVVAVEALALAPRGVLVRHADPLDPCLPLDLRRRALRVLAEHDPAPEPPTPMALLSTSLEGRRALHRLFEPRRGGRTCRTWVFAEPLVLLVGPARLRVTVAPTVDPSPGVLALAVPADDAGLLHRAALPARFAGTD